MASRTDVAMAQFDANTAEEERKMNKRIEDSRTIRNLDNITAMASGAEMGLQIGSTVSSINEGMKGFSYRSKVRKNHMTNEMASGKSRKEARKAWRETGKGEAKALYKTQKDDGLSHKTIVSMYLEGVNDNPSGDGATKPSTSVKNYPEFVGPHLPGEGFVGPVQGSSTTEDNSWYLGKWWNKAKDKDAEIKGDGGLLEFWKKKREQKNNSGGGGGAG